MDAETEKKLAPYMAWKNYECGFTGRGPTAFDTKPDFPKPEFDDENLQQALDGFWKEEQEFRSKAFRDAVLEVTGEDIDDPEI